MDDTPELTPRELQIVQLLAEGYQLKSVSNRLNITYNTLRNHMTSIAHKWNASGRGEIVYTAYCRGLVRK